MTLQLRAYFLYRKMGFTPATAWRLGCQVGNLYMRLR